MRKALIVLLALGAVGGYGAAFARLHAGGGHCRGWRAPAPQVYLVMPQAAPPQQSAP